jgi:hypothetical protein
MNSPGPERTAIETPGPHRLQPRAPRPEDIEYQEKLRAQQQYEEDQQTTAPATAPNVLDIVKQLAKAMRETNTSDTTEPSKFSGQVIVVQANQCLSRSSWFQRK